MKKLIKNIGIGLVALFALSSCERDITSLNVDPKHPTVLPSGNLLATGQYQQFYYVSSSNVNFNNYRFFVQQFTETVYTDESNYDLVNRNQPRNHFSRMYVYALNNFHQATINLAGEVQTAAVKSNMWATLELSQIAVWENLVDTYGDIPYSESLNVIDGSYAPKYDDAKTIYDDLFKRIDAAIAKIDVTQPGYSSGDLVYAGDMSKWKKLANSLKLRLAMNLADVDAAKSKSMAEAAVAGGVMLSSADDYALTFDGGTFSNPLYDDLVASGRSDFVPSDRLINYMNASSDPRREYWFTKVGGIFKGGVYGSLNTFGNFSHITSARLIPDPNDPTGVKKIPEHGKGDFSFADGKSPSKLLSYEEVAFLKTEGAARAYSMGGTAASLFSDAIQASMTANGVATADAAIYIAAHPYNASNWKQSIGEEAWVALFNQAFAAWNFTRRLDNPVLTIPANSKTTTVPMRMPYSDQEYVLNKTNVSAAATKIGGDKAETKLFWDKF